jgi:hypothetical protein
MFEQISSDIGGQRVVVRRHEAVRLDAFGARDKKDQGNTGIHDVLKRRIQGRDMSRRDQNRVRTGVERRFQQCNLLVTSSGMSGA